MMTHIVAFFITIITQFCAIVAFIRLKKIQSSRAKLTFYWIVLLLQSMSAIAAWKVMPEGTLWTFDEPVKSFTGLPILLIFVAVYLIITFVLPFILLFAGYKPFVQSVKQNFTNKQFLHPIQNKERVLYFFVVVSIGVSEEIVFRSFFVHYLHSLPLGLSWTTSFIFAVLLFAVLHFHQGVSGIWNALMVGALFSFLFIATGSLLLPIVLHIIYDLKIVFNSYIIAHHVKS